MSVSAKGTQELPYLNELSGAELLALILNENNPVASREVDHIIIDALAPDVESDVFSGKKLVARMLKKARQKEERKKRAEAKLNKKIAFLLEGDRLAEIERCKRWEERLVWHTRMQLAYRNSGIGGGGGSASSTNNVKPPPPPPMKYCSICKRSHP